MNALHALSDALDRLMPVPKLPERIDRLCFECGQPVTPDQPSVEQPPIFRHTVCDNLAQALEGFDPYEPEIEDAA
jgi:hypothetical protein